MLISTQTIFPLPSPLHRLVYKATRFVNAIGDTLRRSSTTTSYAGASASQAGASAAGASSQKQQKKRRIITPRDLTPRNPTGADFLLRDYHLNENGTLQLTLVDKHTGEQSILKPESIQKFLKIGRLRVRSVPSERIGHGIRQKIIKTTSSIEAHTFYIAFGAAGVSVTSLALGFATGFAFANPVSAFFVAASVIAWYGSWVSGLTGLLAKGVRTLLQLRVSTDGVGVGVAQDGSTTFKFKGCLPISYARTLAENAPQTD